MHLKGGVIITIIIVSVFLLIACAKAIAPSELVISKVQITGGVGKTSEDFITIYNASPSPIDLNGLRLVKRTKTGTSDTTLKSWVSPVLVNPGAYYTWANSSNGFSESIQADCSSSQTISDDNGIALREGAENSGTIIDSIAWGEASNIFVENSAFPTNHIGGQYLKRKNNLDTNNNALDFEIYPPQEIIEDNPIIINLGDIRINELVSDPDQGDEWIELYNTTSKIIDLKNLTIEDGSNTKTILNGQIEANKFFIISSPKGALNNSGDIIVLKNADGEIIDSITYGDWDDGNISDNALAAQSPYSLARIIDGESTTVDNADFKITTTPTKGLPNIITELSTEINETTTPSDGYDYSKEIIISEIFPNPPGLDNESNEEFIEIYNKGTKAVFLDGWRFELNGLSFALPSGTSLAGKSYLSLKTKSKLPLPNDGAILKLFQPNRLTSYQSINYKKALEGQSFINILGSWQWTSRPTPGTSNISAQAPQAYFELIDEPELNKALRFDSSDSFGADKPLSYFWDFGDEQTNTLANPEHTFTKSGKFRVSLTIKNDYGNSTFTKTITIPKPEKLTLQNDEVIKTDEKNTVTKPDGLVTTAGTAISIPGLHGTQYFYFLPEFGEPLYQIYNSKKLFPKINIGDQLIITGEYNERPEGPRLKTKETKDIQIIGKNIIEEPIASLSTSLNKAPYPRFVLVEGEIVSKKWPRVILADTLGEIELYISSGTKLKTADFTIGDKIKALGILTLSDNKVRLQPRGKEDIKKIENKDFNIAMTEENKATPIITKKIEPELNDTKKSWLIYIISGTILILGVAGYFLQKK